MRLRGCFITLCLLIGVFSLAPLTVQAKTITVTVEAAEEGDDCSQYDIQQCLDEANYDSQNSYKIIVPKGTYTLSSSLHIYNNTTLVLTGVTLKRGAAFERGALILVGNPRAESGKSSSPRGGYTKGGYSRGKNIRVVDGVLDAGTKTKNVTTLFHFLM